MPRLPQKLRVRRKQKEKKIEIQLIHQKFIERNNKIWNLKNFSSPIDFSDLPIPIEYCKDDKYEFYKSAAIEVEIKSSKIEVYQFDDEDSKLDPQPIITNVLHDTILIDPPSLVKVTDVINFEGQLFEKLKVFEKGVPENKLAELFCPVHKDTDFDDFDSEVNWLLQQAAASLY